MNFIKRTFSAFLALGIAFSLCCCGVEKQKERFAAYYFDYFDTVTTIVGYEYTKSDFDEVCAVIKGLLEEYHMLYDIYHKYDGVNNLYTVNEVKDGAHNVVAVDLRVIELIEFSKQMYALTNGYTNIAFGSVLSLWHMQREYAQSNPAAAKLPDMVRLERAAEHTSLESVETDMEAGTVFINDPETTLDVGAVAKGYAVECIADALEALGKSGYLLNVGGNVRAVGTRDGGAKWSAGIENPNGEGAYAALIDFDDKAIVTSGNYQRFYYVDGVRYHHIINPNTLMPENNFKSVSIIADDSGFADALSTALFSMTLDAGKTLVESLDGVEAMWITADDEKIYSDGFEAYMS